MSWDAATKTLHCDHKSYRAKDGLPGLANVEEVRCPATVTGSRTALQARQLARTSLYRWEFRQPIGDRCAEHKLGDLRR